MKITIELEKERIQSLKEMTGSDNEEDAVREALNIYLSSREKPKDYIVDKLIREVRNMRQKGIAMEDKDDLRFNALREKYNI